MSERKWPNKHHNANKGKPFDKEAKFGVKKKRWQLEDEEIQDLQKRYGEINCANIKRFIDFPLCKCTLKGLRDANFDNPTDIQTQSIGLALQGQDVLGAAKTGSGKTLAFLIPILECLFRVKWTPADGLGALIISPTRELAYQTFEVLRKVGKFHDFSAGLVIGGKHVRDEAERINTTNIVICTPGRLLQHMDQTVNFNADNLHVLVLDEADRILDLGFQQTMNAIISNLPKERQTLLFSATQTKSVKDLARLSLKDPTYVSVHEHAAHSTPSQLQQSYIVCELHEKLDLLWSFIKHHLKSKILVFLSSCKEVRFVFEVFRQLRPGVPVLGLHGAMPQSKRMAVYSSFIWKQSAVLFATDIAARGLDFPAVNWVIQLDCPEDANTYIHRAGRTARYERDGEALLILLPSEEEAMVQHLKQKKIPIECIKVNPNKQHNIQMKLSSLLAADVELKQFAQRAFVSYLKSVFLMKDKSVFDVSKLDMERYSRSLGLAVAPRVRLIQKDQKRQQEQQLKKQEAEQKLTQISKKYPFAVQKQDEDSSEGDSEGDPEIGNSSEDSGASGYESGPSALSDDKTNLSRVSVDNKAAPEAVIQVDVGTAQTGESIEAGSSGVVKGRRGKLDEPLDFSLQDGGEEEELDSFLKVKTKQVEVTLCEGEIETSKEKKEKIKSKVASAKKLIKKNLKVNTKVAFNEEGQMVEDENKKLRERVKKLAEEEEEEGAETGGINLELARKRLQAEDVVDKEIFRQRVKEKHRTERLADKERRRQEREARRRQFAGDEDDEEEPAVTLGVVGDSGSEGSEGQGHSEEEGGDSEEEQSDEDQGDDSDGEEQDDDEDDVEDESASDEDRPPVKRRKGMSGKALGKKLTTKDEDLTTGLSLQDAEQLALRLLQS